MMLTIIFRVTPDADKDNPTYFSQHYSVPKIEDDAKGDAYLSGNFEAGEGNYHIDWLMRDRSERVCSSGWDIKAEVSPKDKQGDLSVVANAVLASDNEIFKDEPPVHRGGNDGALNVKVMVNFAPQKRPRRRRCVRWTPARWFRSCATSRGSRGSASFRSSRLI